MLALRNLTKQRAPRLPFRRLAERALGPKYELSIVFIGNNRSRTLNCAWRGKDQPANILTFPLDANAGEIFLNLDQTSGANLRAIFIHGLAHLKGLNHGSKMESLESQYEQNYRHWFRRRQRVRTRRGLRAVKG